MRYRLAAAIALIAAACSGSGSTTTSSMVELPKPPPLTSFAYTSVLEATIDTGLSSSEWVGTKSGTFVAPDRHTVVSELDFAGTEQPTERVVVIGDEAWYDDGAGWIATARDDARVSRVVDLFTSVDGNLMPQGDVAVAVAGIAPAAERVGEYETLRFDLPADEPERLDALTAGEFFAGLAGSEEIAFSVWVHRDTGVLVKASLNVAGAASLLGGTGVDFGAGATVDVTLTVELAEVNSTNIVIAAPEDVAPVDDPDLLELAVGGFAVDYPRSWSLGPQEVDGDQVFVTLLPPIGGSARLEIAAGPAGDATLDDLAADGLALALEDPTMDVVASDRFDLPAGPVALLEFESGAGTRILQAYLIVDGVAYLLDWRGPGQEFAAFLPEAADIMAGFRVE